MGWFRRKKAPETREDMIARFHAESPAPSSVSASVANEPSGGMLTVEDVFQITDRGTVATGRVQIARLVAGNRVVIHRVSGGVQEVTVKAIDTLGRRVAIAEPPTRVGVTFVEPVSIAPGDALTF